jgi:two-component system, cell cycle sensor histidine kinase and response regulator CckA
MKKGAAPHHPFPGFPRYKAMLEAVPDIIMEVDERKVYTWANRAGLEFFGDDVIGREAADYFIGEQDTYLKVAPLFSGHENVIHLLSWQRRRDGKVRLLAWWCTALTNTAGKSMGALSTARDITETHQAEKALKDSEERFRAIFDNIHDGVILADDRMIFLMVNKTICAMLGYEEKKLIGMSVEHIHPPDKLGFVKDIFFSLLNREISVAPNIPVKRRNGSVFIADIHAALFTLGGSRFIAGFFRDVTERNRMLEALQESEAHYRAVIEASPMGMHLYRVQEGEEPVFSGFNPAAVKILGVSHDQFMNKKITAAFPGLAATEVPDRYARAALYGELWHNEQVDYRDAHIIGAFDVYAFQIRHGLMAAMFSDITDRKKLEQDLNAQRVLTDRIMETSPVCIIMADAAGRITFANSTAEKMMGLTKTEITDRIYNDPAWRITAFDGGPFPKEDLPFQQVIKTGRPVFGVRHAIEWPNGRRVLLSINGSPLTGADGKPAGVVFSIDDITDRIRAEEEHQKLEEHILQSQKMDSIGRLAGGVAHDLNNLLTPIIGYADYFLSTASAPVGDLSPIFRGILGAAERARILTRQLLAFSRKQALAIEVLDLNTVVDSIKTLLSRTLRENIHVRYRLTPGISAIKADHTQIDQIIINLATNAQDALPGGGEISIATTEVEIDETTVLPGSAPAPGAYVLLSFSDNGLGMDNATLLHIFEPFFTTKGKGLGTGLGLATVYGIVKQHNGSIHAYSEPGGGTVFRVYFPAVREKPAPASAPEAAGTTAAVPVAAKILLVEDNADVRGMTERILSSFGNAVVTAENGARAIDVFAEHEDIDLMITDVIMPDMNGVALARTLRSRKPSLRVLFMSGYTDDVLAKQGTIDGESGFITKPFTVRQLKEKVRQVLTDREQSP